MENLLIMAAAVVALVLGGWGIGKVCYERGYVHGYDDAENGDDIVLYTFVTEFFKPLSIRSPCRVT